MKTPFITLICVTLLAFAQHQLLGQVTTRTFQQGTNGYSSAQDTEIRFSDPEALLGDNPAINVDGVDAGGAVQALTRFDNIFGAATNQIPLGENIIEATLTFYSFDPGGLVNFHRMLVDWDEGTATWSNLVSGITADDIEASATVSGSLTGTLNEYVSVDVTADLQAWADGTNNFGWAEIPTADNGWDYDSTENPLVIRRPLLTVSYGVATPPTDTSGGTLPVDANVLEGRPYTLNSSFDGSPTPSYQWFFDGVAIAGATDDTYFIPNMSVAEAGLYSVDASNRVGQASSRTAAISMESDNDGPLLLSTPPNHPVLRDDQSILLTFNEPVSLVNFSPAIIDIYPAGGDPGTENLGVDTFTLTSPTNVVITTTLPSSVNVDYLFSLNAGVIQDLLNNFNSSQPDIPIESQLEGPILQSGGIRSDGTISLRFNEPVNAGGSILGDISIFLSADDPVSGNLGVASVVPGVTTDQLVITTTNPPTVGLAYSVRLLSGSVQDAFGNASASDATLSLDTHVDLLPTGSNWRFLDDGSNQGTAWQLPAFDDSSWTNGPAQLGYGDGDEATLVGFGTNANQKFITTYYRTTFDVLEPADYEGLNFSILRDDGAVAYLNGTEIFRSNMIEAPDPVLFDTLATGTVATANELIFVNYAVDPGLLIQGANSIAVEIHQGALTSSDTSFDLQITGVSTSITGVIPTFTLQPAPSAQVIPEGTSTTYTATADGFPFPTYHWEFNGGTGFAPILNATGQTLSLDKVVPSQSGAYRAVAQNFVGAATSVVVNLTVSPDLTPPTLVSVRGSIGSVQLDFSRDIDPNATNIANYVLDLVSGGGALTITNVIVNGSQVILQHAEQQPVGRYQVTITDVTDTTATGNLITPNPASSTYESDMIIIPTDGIWNYLDDGSNQGTAWREVGFNDLSWANGPAELGYGDGDEATVLGFGPSTSNKFATTYFRRTFTINDPTGFTNITANLHYDDGAITYINGVEVNRVNITNDLADAVAFDDYAGPTATDNRFELITIPKSMLVVGENTIAVEIHQANQNSSDISFSLELIGQTGVSLPDIVLDVPSFTGGDILLNFNNSGAVYIQETDSIQPPATWITLPGGPHASPLNVGPPNGTTRRYFRATDTP